MILERMQAVRWHTRSEWRRRMQHFPAKERDATTESGPRPSMASDSGPRALARSAHLGEVVSRVARRIPLRMHAMRHAKGSEVNLRAAPSPIKVSLLKPTDASLRAAAAQLAEHGFCVCTGGLQREIVVRAQAEARERFEKRQFVPGTFTAGGKTIDGAEKPERDDHVLWLQKHVRESGTSPPTLAALDSALTAFGDKAIGELSKLPHSAADARGRFARFDDGEPLHCTGRSDMMVACYDGGRARYGLHIDSLDGDGRDQLDHGRCFTLVYYLNTEWDPSRQGGALRLFLPPADPAEGAASAASEPNVAIDLAPHGDTFVIFRADRLVHEVRPSLGSRLAATIWFYGGSSQHRKNAIARGAIQGA
jgi:Rps23 Pro-64 3,4-dihydroxylase Tpa1-like proline 4-hydroxylase